MWTRHARTSCFFWVEGDGFFWVEGDGLVVGLGGSSNKEGGPVDDCGGLDLPAN